MTTGLGVYRIFLNGKEVGEEFLKPGFTHFGKTRLSFTYDITEAFKKAKDKSTNSRHRPLLAGGRTKSSLLTDTRV